MGNGSNERIGGVQGKVLEGRYALNGTWELVETIKDKLLNKGSRESNGNLLYLPASSLVRPVLGDPWELVRAAELWIAMH